MHHTSSTNNPHFPLQNCHIPCIFSPVWPPPPSSRLNLKSCCISSHFNHYPVSPSHHSCTLPPLSQLHNSLSISNLGLVSTNLLVPLLLHFPHGIPVLDSDRQMLQYILMGQGLPSGLSDPTCSCQIPEEGMWLWANHSQSLHRHWHEEVAKVEIGVLEPLAPFSLRCHWSCFPDRDLLIGVGQSVWASRIPELSLPSKAYWQWQLNN